MLQHCRDNLSYQGFLLYIIKETLVETNGPKGYVLCMHPNHDMLYCLLKAPVLNCLPHATSL